MTKQNQFDDRREWTLGQYEVNYIHLDYRFGFDLSDFRGSNGYLKIIIEVPFFLRDGTNETVIDPVDLVSVCDALQILRKLAQKIVVHRSGMLEVFFQDDLSIKAEKHPQFESWEATGEGELSDIAFLCSPRPGPPWKE